jgi:hypothetical protein
VSAKRNETPSNLRSLETRINNVAMKLRLGAVLLSARKKTASFLSRLAALATASTYSTELPHPSVCRLTDSSGTRSGCQVAVLVKTFHEDRKFSNNVGWKK